MQRCQPDLREPTPEPPRRKIIVGLGNPGARYAGTRHNVGFDCIDGLAERWGIVLSDKRQNVVLGEGVVEGVPVALAKPRTFMNNSGLAVRYLLDRFHAQPSDLVIIYDEMDLPLGVIRLRPRGGTAGHQGMASIVGVVGGSAFPRVRVGIGKPERADDWVDYVLAPFAEEEMQLVGETIGRVVDCVDSLLREGIDRAMNRFNTPPDSSLPSPSTGKVRMGVSGVGWGILRGASEWEKRWVPWHTHCHSEERLLRRDVRISLPTPASSYIEILTSLRSSE